MSVLNAALRGIEGVPGGKMKERLIYELKYACRVSEATGGRHDALIMGAAESVRAAVNSAGALTDEAALEIEKSLMGIQNDLKKYKLILCGHAHIDMNWMWRYDETVQITLDTFKTVLDLMDEYPDFTFSQSQASVYRIAEEFAPPLIERIAERAREGRWEVTANTWVEADRNMPSAESVARHQLYTRRYLTGLLDLPGDMIPPLDFEPDTFGHSRNTPELLRQAGIQYYYHCRGFDKRVAYRWRAPSGAEVIAYREPFWYNGAIDGDIAEYVPAFCEEFGVTSALRVYGVGDHGGGPTRRDIERAIDMMDWPLFPRVVFGSYSDFFSELGEARENLPVVDDELNAIFVGCYTTQTKIKKGNRYAERLLGEAEKVNALAHIAQGQPYDRAKFEGGWRNVLFNQFHDILPGSCVPDTREHASGLYQQAYAVANSARWATLNAIAERVDTSKIISEPSTEDSGQGAGTGYAAEETIDIAPVGRGVGDTRIFHLFNALDTARREPVKLTVWDYTHKDLLVTTADGALVRHQVLGGGHNSYWGHDYAELLIEANIPANGYATYVVRPDTNREQPFNFFYDWRAEQPDDYILENDYLRLIFDPMTGDSELVDKQTGSSYLIDGFSLVGEDPSRGMTAWTNGQPMGGVSVSGNGSIRRGAKGKILNELIVEAAFGERSSIKYTLGLAAGSRTLTIDAECDFLEIGDEQRLPQLRFDMSNPGMSSGEYMYDIPGGTMMRDDSPIDLPGGRFIAAGRLMLMTDSKYGYRGEDGSIGVTLIRASINPDRYPELGKHRFRLGVSVLDEATPGAAIARARSFLSPVTPVSGTTHPGEYPASGISLMRLIRGDVEINAVKLMEDSEELVVRGVEISGGDAPVELEFFGEVERARMVDTHEHPCDQGEARADGSRVSFTPRPHGLFSLAVKFK